jgi:hypothetical protein
VKRHIDILIVKFRHSTNEALIYATSALPMIGSFSKPMHTAGTVSAERRPPAVILTILFYQGVVDIIAKGVNDGLT